MKASKSIIWASTIVLMLFFTSQFGCNKNKKFSFDKPDKAFIPYISGFTGGLIGTMVPIRIRLVNQFSEEQQQNIEDLFSFTPKIKGKTNWIDKSTIEFVPEQKLAQGQFYNAEFNLGKLQKMPEKLKVFKFQFATLHQSAQVVLSPMRCYADGKSKNMFLEGSLETADWANEANVKKALKATQNGKTLTINWLKSNNKKKFHFTIEHIERQTGEGKVLISFEGKEIDCPDDLREIAVVPNSSSFYVLDARLSSDEDPSILVYFSQLIDNKQELDGLISIYGVNSPGISIEGSLVKVYAQNWDKSSGTVNLDKNIRSADGLLLGENRSFGFSAKNEKPEVRMLQSGVILPNSKGLIVPFQVAFLNAVDVTVSQVFENNVLQLMQETEINEEFYSYSMNKVAKTILNTRIDLDVKNISNRSKFTTHAIKLDELIKTQPGAIYKIKLSFKKEYSTYPCAEGSSEAELRQIEGPIKQERSDYSYNEGYDYEYDSYEYNYDEDYSNNYQNRQNPCHQAFYNNVSEASVNILASDLGIIAQQAGENKWYFTATNLLTAKPASGVTFEVYNFQKQLLTSFNTNSEGFANWTNDSEDEPMFLIGKMGTMRSYLKLNRGRANNVSNFDVSGNEVPEGIKGSIFAERGVWRPGDTLFVNFVMDDRRNPLPASHPIIFELINSRGQSVNKLVKGKAEGASLYSFACATDANAPTGNYRAQVKVGNSFFTKTLRVETIIPNRIKINIDVPEKGYSVKSASQLATIKANWLHGAPAAGLRANIKVNATALKTEFPNFKDYSFSDPTVTFSAEETVLFDAELDDDGKAKFSAIINTDRRSPGTLNLGFNVRVFEQGGAFSSDRFSTQYKAYPTYLGLKLPSKNTQGGLAAAINQSFDLVSVNESGTVVGNKKVSVDVYQINKEWWWQRSEESMGDFYNANYVKPYLHQDIVTNSNGRGNFKMNVKLDDRGYFLVKVTDVENGHSAGEVIFFGTQNDTQTNEFYSATSPINIQLQTAKKEYEVGEEIKVNIPTMSNAQVLISVENSHQVLSKKWIKADGNSTVFTFKASKEFAPNVFVRATVIQPHYHPENDLPIRLFGLVRINVTDKNTQLTPIIKMPETVRPESVMEVSVSEKNGKPMEYCLALVDEGLLDLTRFKTPNLWPDFYTQEALGVVTWDIFDDVIGAYGGELESVVTIGGDGESAGKGKGKGTKANRFKPMVRVISPLFLAAGKTNKHRIAIPVYVGSCRLMVIASNSQGAYGQAEKTVKVQSPLMLLGTLPRVLTPNERIKVPINLFANNLSTKNTQVSITAEGPVGFEGATKQTVNFQKTTDEQLAYFDLKVKDKTGIAKVFFTATSGKEMAKQSIEIEIRTPNLPIHEDIEQTVNKNSSFPLNLPLIGMEGSNKATVELSTMPPINITARLNYLMTYPHGCVEQTTSAAFPQIFVAEMIDLPEAKLKEMQSNVRIAIKKLSQFQLSDGSFAYWQGLQKGDEWCTSYVGHFLLEAQKSGYQINNSVLDKWKKYQKNKANQWGIGNDKSRNYYNDDVNQAYRLFTLALAKMPQTAAMNKLREMGNISSAAAWRLASAYSMIGQAAAAQSMILKAVNTTYSSSSWAYSYGSSERDDAVAAEALIYLQQYSQALLKIKEISKKLSSEQYMSTQTTAYCLLAVNRFIQAQPTSKGINCEMVVNGKSFTLKSEKPILTIDFPTPTSKGWNGTITNKAGGIVYSRIINTGTPGTVNVAKANSKIDLSVRFTNSKGNELNTNEIIQGEDFIASITVSNISAGNEARNLALSALFPGAWEINNSRMEENNILNQNEEFDYQDIRDDRVLTYFSLPAKKSITYKFRLNAAYVGKFYAPSISCEAMYDHTIFARSAGNWIEVIKRKPKVNS